VVQTKGLEFCLAGYKPIEIWASLENLNTSGAGISYIISKEIYAYNSPKNILIVMDCIYPCK